MLIQNFESLDIFCAAGWRDGPPSFEYNTDRSHIWCHSEQKDNKSEWELYMQEKLGKWKIVDLEIYLPLYIIKVLISLDN